MNLLTKARLFLAQKLLAFGGTPITMESYRGQVTWGGQNAEAFINEGYAGNDIVYAVISLITNKTKVAPWGAYKIKDEKKYRQYKALISNITETTDFVQLENLKNQSLEPYNGDARLNELLKYPNQQDTWSDLIETWAAYKLSVGNAYIYGQLIQAGNNKGKPFTLTALPAQYMQLKANVNLIPSVVVGYQLYLGLTQDFTLEEILHDKFPNLRADANGMQLYGMSPLQAAYKTITRSNESKTAAIANLQNGGPQGIIYTDDQRMNGEAAVAQANALRNKLAEFSGARNKNKLATSAYKTGFTQIGLSNVDLDIINQEMWDMRLICNIYGVPSQLLNDPANKAEANAIQAEKALTTRAALPLLTAMQDNLNRKLQSDWGYKGQNIVVGFDISAYPELQEDRVSQVNWLDKSLLPLKERYRIMGLNPEGVSEEMLNTIYYQGQPLGDATEIIDVYGK